MPPTSTPSRVNPPCSLTSQSKGETFSHISFKLLANKVPKTAEYLHSDPWREKDLVVKVAAFTRITLECVCQGGDFSHGKGTSGKFL